MKLSCKQLLPVALGTGLWLLGNMILTPGPAEGNNPEAQQIPSCTSYTVENTSGLPQCGPPPQCSGRWSDYYYYPSDCSHGTRDEDNSECVNGTGQVAGFFESGTCYPLEYGNHQYVCQMQTDKEAPVSMPNAPMCNTIYPPPEMVHNHPLSKKNLQLAYAR